MTDQKIRAINYIGEAQTILSSLSRTTLDDNRTIITKISEAERNLAKAKKLLTL